MFHCLEVMFPLAVEEKKETDAQSYLDRIWYSRNCSARFERVIISLPPPLPLPPSKHSNTYFSSLFFRGTDQNPTLHQIQMMLNVWKWYQKCLAVHPVKTQIISSGFLWGLGDVAAQSITHSTFKKHLQNPEEDEEFKINWKRVATTSMFGFAFVGPIGHFWYEGLDRLIRHRFHLQPKSMRFVTAKVAMDGLIFGPLDLFVFFSYMGLSAGKSVAQVKEDVKRDFIPALVLEGGIWPLVQVANFRYIPVKYQLLYVNTFCLLDSAFLSWLEQQEDAPWKQWFTSFLALEEEESQS